MSKQVEEETPNVLKGLVSDEEWKALQNKIKEAKKEKDEQTRQSRRADFLRRCLKLNNYFVGMSTLFNIRNDVNNLKVWNRENLLLKCPRRQENDDDDNFDPHKESQFTFEDPGLF